MTKNTNITELDIINFVFFNELLSEGKRQYIKFNEGRFEQLRFYRKQKNIMNEIINVKTKEKLAAKIPAYKISQDKNHT